MTQLFSRVGKVLFGRYLLLTNTVSCGALLGIGDLSTQALERSSGLSKKQDWTRTGRLVALGAVLGPINHVWYGALDKFLLGNSAKTVVQKILLDQTIASPVFAFTFFMGVGTLEGQSLRRSWNDFTGKFWQVYKADWMLWPAAQAINFSILPSHFRVVYVASVTCVWNSFLSYMKHKDHHHSPPRPPHHNSISAPEHTTSMHTASMHNPSSSSVTDINTSNSSTTKYNTVTS